jgi:hypothetical protein
MFSTLNLNIFSNYTECSLCRLIRRPGSFSERSVGRHCGIPRQTEDHSFSEHLISESVSVMPSSVIEASFYCSLICVFMAHVRYNLEQRVFIYDCYVKKTHTNCAGENFAVNLPTQHINLEIQFPNQ